MYLGLFTEDKNKFLHILKELENFKEKINIILFSTSELESKEVSFNKEILKITNINDFKDFKNLDFCIFDVNNELTDKYIYDFIENDCVVLNTSSNFIEDNGIPTIIYDINKKDIKKYENKNIINLPSPSTIQLDTILNLFKKKIKNVVVSTYQSASSLSKNAMDELFNHTKKIYENSFLPPVNFKKQIPFNVLPQVGDFYDKTLCEEEYKIIKETEAILKIKPIVTCALVPTFTCNCQSVYIEFNEELKDFNKILKKSSDEITIIDDPEEYTTPKETSGEYNIFVSRIRLENNKSATLWTVADNLVLFSKNVADILGSFIV